MTKYYGIGLLLSWTMLISGCSSNPDKKYGNWFALDSQQAYQWVISADSKLYIAYGQQPSLSARQSERLSRAFQRALLRYYPHAAMANGPESRDQAIASAQAAQAHYIVYLDAHLWRKDHVTEEGAQDPVDHGTDEAVIGIRIENAQSNTIVNQYLLYGEGRWYNLNANDKPDEFFTNLFTQVAHKMAAWNPEPTCLWC